MVMAKKLISEWAVIEASKKGGRILLVEDGTIITAAARDKAKQLGIRFQQKSQETGPQPSGLSESPRSKEGGKEAIALGSDHGGFQLKEQLKPFLESLGYKVIDLGAYSEEACDYPDYAYAVARAVSLGEVAKGIMIDAIGVASAMVANKIPGIRAACCHNEFSAKSSREHNNANVLTLGGRILGSELAKSIVKVWLETDFGGGRHQKRVDKISDIERRFISKGS